MSWAKLHDGKSYKIFETGDNWADRLIFGCRYKVVDPDGDHVRYTWTLRGARRAIRRAQAHAKPPSWWDRRIVEEVPRA